MFLDVSAIKSEDIMIKIQLLAYMWMSKMTQIYITKHKLDFIAHADECSFENEIIGCQGCPG